MSQVTFQSLIHTHKGENIMPHPVVNHSTREEDRAIKIFRPIEEPGITWVLVESLELWNHDDVDWE